MNTTEFNSIENQYNAKIWNRLAKYVTGWLEQIMQMYICFPLSLYCNQYYADERIRMEWNKIYLTVSMHCRIATDCSPSKTLNSQIQVSRHRASSKHTYIYTHAHTTAQDVDMVMRNKEKRVMHKMSVVVVFVLYVSIHTTYIQTWIRCFGIPSLSESLWCRMYSSC